MYTYTIILLYLKQMRATENTKMTESNGARHITKDGARDDLHRHTNHVTRH